MRYFEQLRIGWIIESIEIFGFINRSHVSKKFGVTEEDLKRAVLRAGPSAAAVARELGKTL